jgi:hypothetical protein
MQVGLQRSFSTELEPPNKGLQPTRPALQREHVGGTQPGVCVQVARSPRAAAILLGNVRSGPCS